MGVISAKIIKKPRLARSCNNYGCQKVLSPRMPIVRLYGSACEGDPPYTLYLCVKCAAKQSDPKIIKAMEASCKKATE